MNHKHYINPQRNRQEDSDLPVIMFEKPYQWLQDLFYTAVFFVGSITLGAALLAVLVWVTGLHRVFLVDRHGKIMSNSSCHGWVLDKNRALKLCARAEKAPSPTLGAHRT